MVKKYKVLLYPLQGIKASISFVSLPLQGILAIIFCCEGITAALIPSREGTQLACIPCLVLRCIFSLAKDKASCVPSLEWIRAAVIPSQPLSFARDTRKGYRLVSLLCPLQGKGYE